MLLKGWHKALLGAWYKLVTVLGEQLINGVSKRSRHQPRHPSCSPDSPKVVCDLQRCRGTCEHELGTGILFCGHDPKDRIDISEFWMPLQNGATELAVEGGEAEGLLAVMRENQVHALCTEAACAIVDENWATGGM